MADESTDGGTLTTAPLMPERWDDFDGLFRSDGIPRGCWCMHWRLTAKAWKAGDAGSRCAAFRDRVDAGPPPGLLAYLDGGVVGWVQVTPRAEVPRFNAARTARPLPADADLARVWAITCFFLHKSVRGRGLMTPLAAAACRFAVAHGAEAVEAAAILPRRKLIWGEGYVGIVPALERAGFQAIAQRSETRHLMRWVPSPPGASDPNR